MEMIEWTNDFSVGVAAMDEQHKQLINMINQLIQDPAATSHSETTHEMLDKMKDYSLTHLQAEEELMAAHSYPLLETQKTLHRAFREKMIHFCIEWAQSHEALSNDLLTYLRDWWVHHILEEDKKYSSFFHQCGVG